MAGVWPGSFSECDVWLAVCYVVSLALCCRHICLLDQFSASGIDSLTACSDLFSVLLISSEYIVLVICFCCGVFRPFVFYMAFSLFVYMLWSNLLSVLITVYS